jgi:hypothetical protein
MAQRDMSELNALLLAALERGDRDVVPSVEATVLEAVQRAPQEIEKLLKSLRDGDESRVLVRTLVYYLFIALLFFFFSKNLFSFAFQRSLQELEGMVGKVAEKANVAAESEADPKSRKDLLDAVSKLDGLLSQLKPATVTSIKRPADRRSQVAIIIILIIIILYCYYYNYFSLVFN